MFGLCRFCVSSCRFGGHLKGKACGRLGFEEQLSYVWNFMSEQRFSLVEHLFDQGVCRTVGTLPDISHDAANVCKNSTYIRNRPNTPHFSPHTQQTRRSSRLDHPHQHPPLRCQHRCDLHPRQRGHLTNILPPSPGRVGQLLPRCLVRPALQKLQFPAR